MERMSSNDKHKIQKYGDSSQLTNWILDSGVMCHMKPEVSDFVPGSLEDTDKYIEVADWHHLTAKQKGQAQIKMCNGHGYPFIAMLHNVLLDTRFMRQVIFKNYVNEFRTFLFIPQGVLHCVIWIKG